jgi:plastocyanin
MLVLVSFSIASGAGTVKGTITSDGAASAPLASAVVMVDGPSARAVATSRVVVDQRDQMFIPHVVAVAAGTTVDFPNHDTMLHNVYSASPAKRFDLDMYRPGETRSVRFDTPGVVRLRCNVHSAMEGFVVVHSNPYVAVTDAQGVYTIPNVPAGTYQVRVWHETAPAEKQLPVVVRDDSVTPLDVKLPIRR